MSKSQISVPFGIGLLLTAAYWPGISGVATTPRWMVGALIGLPLIFAPAIRVHLIAIVCAAWLLLTLWWTPSLDGLDAALKLTIVAGAYAYGSTLKDIRPLAVGAVLGLSLSSVVAIAQLLGWDGIESWALPAGLFYNGDKLAAAAALVIVLCFGLRLWWFIPGLIPALLIPLSRGALLAACVGLIPLAGVLLLTRRRRAAMIALTLPIVAALLYWRGLSVGITDRIALWQDTLAAVTPFGHGLGSFAQTFPQIAHHFDLTVSRPDHPHNEWLWLGYEAGLCGVALAGVLSAVLWRACAVELRGALVVLFVLSLVAMPLHDPATAILGALLAGHGVRDRLRHGDPARAGRMALRASLAAHSS